MKKIIEILGFAGILLILSGIQLQAQNDINFENLSIHPEVEVIIGLNQPTIDQEIQFTHPDVIDVIINDIRDNEESEDDELIEELEDLQDAMGELDDPPSEPDKEELILVKELGELDLNIYPNPAKDFIKLQFDETDNYEVEIYDLIGNKVLSEIHSVEFGTELKFNLSNFQSGVYVMYIKTETAMTLKKFAIKH